MTVVDVTTNHLKCQGQIYSLQVVEVTGYMWPVRVICGCSNSDNVAALFGPK